MERTSCLNCGLSSFRERRYLIAEIGPEIIHRLQQWQPQLQFSNEDFICNQCMNAVQRSLNDTESSQRHLGHQHVCAWCGRSILRARSNALRLNTPERSLIERRISPRQLPEETRVCYACWVAAKTNIQRSADANAARQLEDVVEGGASSSAEVNIVEQPVPEEVELVQPVPEEVDNVVPQLQVILLPSYKRTAATAGHCLYPNCHNGERLRVPKNY